MADKIKKSVTNISEKNKNRLISTLSRIKNKKTTSNVIEEIISEEMPPIDHITVPLAKFINDVKEKSISYESILKGNELKDNIF